MHVSSGAMRENALRQHLYRTEQYVAEGEYHLAQQQARIARLKEQGDRIDVARAIELLAQMKRLQAIHLEHRERLRALLDPSTQGRRFAESPTS